MEKRMDKVARMERALQLICKTSTGEFYCESFTSGVGSCYRNGRLADAEYTADRWCDACIAYFGLYGRFPVRIELAPVEGFEPSGRSFNTAQPGLSDGAERLHPVYCPVNRVFEKSFELLIVMDGRDEGCERVRGLLEGLQIRPQVLGHLDQIVGGLHVPAAQSAAPERPCPSFKSHAAHESGLPVDFKIEANA